MSNLYEKYNNYNVLNNNNYDVLENNNKGDFFKQFNEKRIFSSSLNKEIKIEKDDKHKKNKLHICEYDDNNKFSIDCKFCHRRNPLFQGNYRFCKEYGCIFTKQNPKYCHCGRHISKAYIKHNENYYNNYQPFLFKNID